MKDYKCPKCKNTIDIKNTFMGVCMGCASEGYWVDPVGSLHSPEPENVACDDFYFEGSIYE